MGGGQERFNAPHRFQNGWLHPASTLLSTANSIVTVKSSSVNTITDPALALVRVVRSGVVYWLSYRTPQPAGSSSFDSKLAAIDGNSVFIHRFNSPGHTLLVARLGLYVPIVGLWFSRDVTRTWIESHFRRVCLCVCVFVSGYAIMS